MGKRSLKGHSLQGIVQSWGGVDKAAVGWGGLCLVT